MNGASLILLHQIGRSMHKGGGPFPKGNKCARKGCTKDEAYSGARWCWDHETDVIAFIIVGMVTLIGLLAIIFSIGLIIA